ncbi:virulence RhuM family protein [Christensenellaceae bacterium NSJ-44]|uniref:Virulence RhuM family protein n=1 Tax=Luoshenia tenuis TaxID=2763654 RepID=A0A926D1G8_9FIRM|nr:virulence RhuM family protein [Luoshenia tenuis]MBC8529807.1 virulence RhuM family protein [Luoshenia tenuis]
MDNITTANILLYETEEGKVNVSVYYANETFWLTQKAMAELFDVQIPAISKHLKNIFLEGELDEKVVVSKMEITTQHGAIEGKTQTKYAQFYNLDAIIAVGYRVNSKKATHFRQWATNTLKEYIIKGFVLNDDMLKNGRPFGQDYFDELLERIREIRASERRFYQKITDIYKECSYDYRSDSEITNKFFQNTQNKLLFAITGQTAPELISERADSKKEHMGLTTWKNAPDGKILKSDVTVSKNYLQQRELSELNAIVNMYLDYAEMQAQRNNLMSMSDWADRLDAFLRFNEYEILNNLGKVTRAVADELAIGEYEKFRVIQDREFISDFDKATKKMLESRDKKS